MTKLTSRRLQGGLIAAALAALFGYSASPAQAFTTDATVNAQSLRTHPGAMPLPFPVPTQMQSLPQPLPRPSYERPRY